MVKRYKGGLMGSTEATTSTSDSRGMWGTVQATQARNVGNWAGLLATETPGPGTSAGFANGFMTVSNVAVTDSGYNVLNDTPNISTAGGFIKLTGRGFVSGCVVYVGGVAATSTTFISSTEVRAQIAAATSNTLMVYVVNPDGSTGIKLSSLVFSGTPAWSTGETLSGQVSDTAFSVFFSATSDSAVSYALTSGSSLPPGTSLFANGLFTGTVTGISNDTTYSFSVDAIDAENQDTARTFSVTFSTGDAYFYLTPVLLNGEANVWIRDSSVNNFLPTVGNDTRPSAFSPFGDIDTTTGSAYFDGTGDHLIIADNTAMELGAGDFCVECWIYPTSVSSTAVVIDKRASSYAPILLWRSTSTLQLYSSLNGSSWGLANGVTVGALVVNTWYHVAIYRVGSSLYTSFNGTVTLVTASGSGTLVNNATNWYIGTETNGSTNPWTGYISNLRFIVGSSPYGATTFTPPTQSLSAIANTQLLTLQYRTGENNHRFIDESGVKALTTRGGNAHQGSFSPFSPAGWSHYFDGSSYYDFTASTTFNEFLTDDFTVECWLYYTGTDSFSGNPTALSVVATWSTSVSYEIEVQSSGVVRFAAGDNIPIDLRSSGAGLITANAWYHVAAARASGVTRLFINGANVAAHSGSVSIRQAATNMRIGGFPGGGNRWTGYISDLRIVKGQAAYTANFTPATSSLSTTSQSITSANVFLGCNTNRFIDANTTPKTISSFTSAPKVQAFSPFRGSGFYTPATHGGSAYFDGSGDYVYVTQSSTMTLGTNNHCIEFWMYPNGTQNQYANPWYYNGSIVYYFSVGSDSNQAFLLVGGGSPWSLSITIGSTDYLRTLNNWTHVVITRSGTAFRVFYNGVLVGYGTTAQSIAAQTTAFSIGWDLTNATTYYKGWLSNFRVINGSVPTAYQTAVTTTGTSVFTPPTAVPAFEANTAMVMNFTNGGIVDATGRNVMETAGTVRISNVASKFGIGSINFGTRTDYLAIPPTPAIAILGGDFTLEAWVYPTDISVSQTWGIIDARQSAGSAAAWIWRLESYSSGWLLNFYTGTNYSSSGRVQANVWTHIATVRSGTTVTFYINGSASGTATVSGAITGTATTNPIYIGTKDTGSGSTYGTVGYIDDLRITNGFARTITLPTSAHLTR
jgi:hypothetical protein